MSGKSLSIATAALVLVAAAKALVCGQDVRQLAMVAGPSIVVVTAEDRDGKESGLGSGFVISDDGLIATALHVIGEARPVWVQTADGKRHAVREVHASDRTLDLAILRIDADELPVLKIAGEDETLQPGELTVAIGHPLGLKHSIVSGQVAGTRTFDGVSMWQVGMTIEPGNSGCPLLAVDGTVHGVVVMKSTGQGSFGFAVAAEHLRKLMQQPNPISMANWKTIGRIDRRRWEPRLGARWRQRSGRIHVEGAGAGFGGRALLLRKDDPPEAPFELAVSVKLDDEAGAAGLVFHADGEDRHYGFYPSVGRLRLTHFQGPTVFSWKVMEERATSHYRANDWNEIKVRVEKDRIIGFVNGEEVMSVDEVVGSIGRIGLCKFRDTKAQFKRFRCGPEVSTQQMLPAAAARQLAEEMQRLAPRSELLDADLQPYTQDLGHRQAILERQARELESKATQLRALGADLHVVSVCEKLNAITSVPEDADIDLMEGALWIARLDNAELEVDSYLEAVADMVTAIGESFTESDTASEKLDKLDAYLFQQHGYHGSRTDYYNAANSHLDRVIDDREGLPITLSVLYMTLAQRVGLQVVGVGLPGHFVVRHEGEDPAQLIDVFDRGKRMTQTEATELVRRMTRRTPTEQHFASAKHRDILYRMLFNLLQVARGDDDPAAMLRYLEALVTIQPDDASMRGMRAVIRHQQGRQRAALEDLDWILANRPAGVDLRQVRRMREMFAQ